jgi:hypothetical protein
MTVNTQNALWVRTESVMAGGDAALAQPAGTAGLVLSASWQSIDGRLLRTYAQGHARPGPSWQELQAIQVIPGAAAGQPASFHYVVETDVLPENADALNDWYAREHLPGLAAVAGTIRAARYRRLDGSPMFYACYDLVAPDVLASDAWLSVRNTDWSSRVRPMFRNPLRTMFRRVETPAEALDGQGA